MTITYTAEVATCKGFGCFLKLLGRWKGSIYKLVWMDLLVFLSLYYGLNFLYRFHLNAEAKSVFESLVNYCNSYGSLIPLSFVLGFYVSVVMQRWWDQYMSIPWPDPIAVFVSAHVHGQDERGRVMRRTVMRYVCLCQTIVFTLISPRVKKRFPTLNHLVEAGLLLENEKEVIEGMDRAFPKHPKHWMTIVWAASIITRARKEGRIRDDFAVKTIIDELNKFRGLCGVLMYFNTISVPLVYTQVVTLAVYSYFLCSVMGQQWTQQQNQAGYLNFVDLYFPVFTTLQFFFYMGWLKVAESLINPFGDDDDDFEVNWMIDRNLQVSYLIVDEMHHEHPELVKDQYWDEVFPNELPYANDMDVKREEPPEMPTAKLDLNESILSGIKIESSEIQVNGKRHRDSLVSQPSRSSLSRFNGALRRFISRDGSRGLESKEALRSSEASLEVVKQVNSLYNGQVAVKSSGFIRIADDEKFEEVDEPQTLTDQQSTITTPNIRELFRQRDYSNGVLEDKPTSSDGGDKDEFQRLKEERERERIERQKQKFARNIGNATNINIECDPQTNAIPIITAIIPVTSSNPANFVQLHTPAVTPLRSVSRSTSVHPSGSTLNKSSHASSDISLMEGHNEEKLTSNELPGVEKPDTKK